MLREIDIEAMAEECKSRFNEDAGDNYCEGCPYAYACFVFSQDIPYEWMDREGW